MDALGLLFGMLLLWVLGIACLAALPRRTAWWDEPGAIAWTVGAGGLAGLFLATLWLRVLSLAGIAFSVTSLALPLLAAALALGAWVVRRNRLTRGSLRDGVRDVFSRLKGGDLDNTSRLVWRLLLLWLALRFALLAVEITTRPLFPWDAWTQWATKARVWYEVGRIVPFERSDVWFAANGAAYFDAAPNYPGTVGLMQVLASSFLGHWDDTLMNAPFWVLTVAFAFAVYGALRAMAFSPMWALCGTWLVTSLPLVNAHVALAGYADLPLAIYFCVGVLASLRWLRSREPSDAALALLLVAACPLLKIPGRIWALLVVPALAVGLLPRLGPRIVGASYAVMVLGLLLLAQTSPVVMGYQLHIDFAPDWEALANSFFLNDNWHLLWYGAIVAAILGRRHLFSPQVAPLTVVVAGGVIFLGFVFLFTNARTWLSDQSTVNRAALHVAPLVCIWMLVTFRAWAQSLAVFAPPAAAVESVPELPPSESPPAATVSP